MDKAPDVETVTRMAEQLSSKDLEKLGLFVTHLARLKKLLAADFTQTRLHYVSGAEGSMPHASHRSLGSITQREVLTLASTSWWLSNPIEGTSQIAQKRPLTTDEKIMLLDTTRSHREVNEDPSNRREDWYGEDGR